MAAAKKMPAAVKAKLAKKSKRKSGKSCPAHLKAFQFGKGGKKPAAKRKTAKRKTATRKRATKR